MNLLLLEESPNRKRFYNNLLKFSEIANRPEFCISTAKNHGNNLASKQSLSDIVGWLGCIAPVSRRYSSIPGVHIQHDQFGENKRPESTANSWTSNSRPRHWNTDCTTFRLPVSVFEPPLLSYQKLLCYFSSTFRVVW